MDNFDAFHEFFSFSRKNGMDVSVDRGQIIADVSFTAARAVVEGTAAVILTKHTGDADQVSILDTDDFVPERVPFGHSCRFNNNKWSYDRGELSITGTHPMHGRYKIQFRFVEGVKR